MAVRFCVHCGPFPRPETEEDPRPCGLESPVVFGGLDAGQHLMPRPVTPPDGRRKILLLDISVSLAHPARHAHVGADQVVHQQLTANCHHAERCGEAGHCGFRAYLGCTPQADAGTACDTDLFAGWAGQRGGRVRPEDVIQGRPRRPRAAGPHQAASSGGRPSKPERGNGLTCLPCPIRVPCLGSRREAGGTLRTGGSCVQRDRQKARRSSAGLQLVFQQDEHLHRPGDPVGLVDRQGVARRAASPGRGAAAGRTSRELAYRFRYPSSAPPQGSPEARPGRRLRAPVRNGGTSTNRPAGEERTHGPGA